MTRSHPSIPIVVELAADEARVANTRAIELTLRRDESDLPAVARRRRAAGSLVVLDVLHERPVGMARAQVRAGGYALRRLDDLGAKRGQRVAAL